MLETILTIASIIVIALVARHIFWVIVVGVFAFIQSLERLFNIKIIK